MFCHIQLDYVIAYHVIVLIHIMIAHGYLCVSEIISPSHTILLCMCFDVAILFRAARLCCSLSRDALQRIVLNNVLCLFSIG